MEMTAKDKKALKILGAVALVGLLLFVFVLHKGGSGGTGASATQTSTGSGASGGSGSGSGSGSSSEGKQGSATKPQTAVFGGRDPFQPLVADTSNASASSTASSSSPAVVVQSASPEPSTSPSPTSGTDKSSIVHGGHTVTLKDIVKVAGEQEAKVSVDATLYTVKVGQLIVDDFKLVAIHDTCADFMHVTHPFTLCLASKTAK